MIFLNTLDAKKLILTPEYNFLRENKHLNNNIILLGLGGSHSYGTNVEGSDVDIRGIAANTKKEILLGKDFEQVIDNTTDTVIYSLKKIIGLLSDGNPNVLEIIFQKPEDFIIMTDIGKKLVDNKEIFLSKKCFYSFGGYARQQLSRLENKSMRELPQEKQEIHILNSVKNAKDSFKEKFFEFEDDDIKLYVDDSQREDMVTEIFMDINLKHYPLRDYKCMWSEMHNIVKDYGKLGKRAKNAILHDKINKHAMHLVRLMLCGVEILEFGTFSTYMGKHLDLLMDIRNGKFMASDGQMNDEFFKMVNNLENRLNIAFTKTDLPDKPDKEKVENLLYSINEKIVLG